MTDAPDDRPADRPPDLEALAAAYGVHLAYDDALGRHRTVSTESLVAILRSLGADLPSAAGAREALRGRERERWAESLPPVAVAWADTAAAITVRLDATAEHAQLGLALILEQGDVIEWRVSLDECPTVEAADADGRGVVAKRVALPFRGLPPGYHRLRVEGLGGGAVGSWRAAGGGGHETLVVSAPRRAYSLTDALHGERAWGVFLPTYALRSRRTAGVADFTDLAALVAWAAAQGAATVGTLPLLAAFLDGTWCEPSPYSPASALFWNDVYLDLAALPELATTSAARDLVAATAYRQRMADFTAARLVDFGGIATARRPVLDAVAAAFFGTPAPARRAAFDRYVAAHPGVIDYARFRAACERFGRPWTEWPAAARGGRLDLTDYDETAYHTHVYAQWQAHEQLDAVSAAAAAEGSGLYLDAPLGVHPWGYDVWREPDAFALDMNGGAPPDGLFIRGQDWGFPPLHPRRSREQGYRYQIARLRTVMAHAGLLRIDHVMGLHRLFWVPRGMEPTDGTYVTYPHDELYALLCLESHRHRVPVIGEDLGTVPPEVRPAMHAHGVQRMYVTQYAVPADPQGSPGSPADDQVAALNTHDMPPFAGFVAARDVAARVDVGQLAPAEAPEEVAARGRQVQALTRSLRECGRPAGEGLQALLDGALDALAASAAPLVLVSLEDLWLEEESQNFPGTSTERPNWRRRARYDVEEFTASPEVAAALARIDGLRRRTPGGDIEADAAHPTATGDAPPMTQLTPDDLHLFNEGTHYALYHKLGAHHEPAPTPPGGTTPGDPGGAAAAARTTFSVWAPNATAVSVIGDFNGWDPRSHPLRSEGSSGIWAGAVTVIGPGAIYKYHLSLPGGGQGLDKADPFAFHAETSPKTGSIVWDLHYAWSDAEWMAARGRRNALDAPMAIYEMHLGSWMRVPEDGDRSLSYRELAPRLIAHLSATGFTHVEFLPVMEHPFYGSWGYQTTGYFAPTSRYGTPQDFMFLVDELHQAGFGVILDWVPSHFPDDPHGLATFDGTHLYEHEDPRQGFHPDWHSQIFNYSRHEVQSFLISSALFWLDVYHADGLRVDAVASMLYLDYSRKAGEWIPNEYGGRENLPAIDLLRRLNTEVYRRFPDVQTFAEESTSWPLVSRPADVGGLGFGLKWDMGWMHDTLAYMGFDPVYRAYHHGQLTFRSVYAYSENFVLPLSHDEVVHGKGSLLAKMPGDHWQQLANLRLLYGYLYAVPGKKLLFMGDEFGQNAEWDHEHSLEWHLQEDPAHAGIQRWVGDLNALLRAEPALHETDHDPAGMEWVVGDDAAQSVACFLRRDREGGRWVLVACNFTPVPRTDYRVGVPCEGRWVEALSSDATRYGGSGLGNLGGVEAVARPAHGRPYSVALTLPPLAAVFLQGGPAER